MFGSSSTMNFFFCISAAAPSAFQYYLSPCLIWRCCEIAQPRRRKIPPKRPRRANSAPNSIVPAFAEKVKKNRDLRAISWVERARSSLCANLQNQRGARDHFRCIRRRNFPTDAAFARPIPQIGFWGIAKNDCPRHDQVHSGIERPSRVQVGSAAASTRQSHRRLNAIFSRRESEK